ncbi:MAG: Uracil-DNA glycosylase, family 4 [uncultured Thermomicrobiales bacterium]|uniref:Type-4 uracil-DNA glycosylase n=1 Tax=uncultured Thermomicrobiales bacterium TaxID=1645740 RepID=A0A6J4VBA9_9BACT|nr:MAG: Uracil-DNA glycosylase, family 4 [uncultured Thermomicrobiales bacterium]
MVETTTGDERDGRERIVIELAEVAAEVKGCPKCELARTRTNAVPGDGNPNARVMLIGEGPGYYEDRDGRPFVGNAGKFLNELLAKAGLSRDEVFVTNVVKCRPPGNRDPLPDEMAACAPYLERQIAAIDPEIIVTLGRFSMSRWFPGERISKIHGHAKRDGKRLIVPMYHPAAALHQAALRGAIEDDFAQLPKILAELEANREAATEASRPPDQQMTLF